MGVRFLCALGSGLCDEGITRSEESYRVCLTMCDLETTTMRWPTPSLAVAQNKMKVNNMYNAQ